MGRIAVIILLAFFLQTLLTILQIKSYQKNLSEMVRQGKIIIGREKGMLSSGCVVLIRIDDDFQVLETRYMKGITVFNRFKLYEEINGKNVLNSELWLKDIKHKRIRNAINNAIEIMYEKLNYSEEVEGSI
ncbi:transcriptional regulator GutM [Irregularibacter muris]|uniref:Transcriptional regulator GutM n=1 Tax=Irregularibacter muris TaxID=1796619 RepID=A0AAE3KZ26_9FIRM|nr:transcriptional regulator GutM [Irregularibacter muris]MCR1897557.1 transcriptional regulator GutM [Irregularibacter muris]